MPKNLTDKELAQVVNNAVNGDIIACSDSYLAFVESLADLVAEHFGGERGCVDYTDDSDDVIISFKHNECVPEDGGIYADYDKDVSVEDWKNEVE